MKPLAHTVYCYKRLSHYIMKHVQARNYQKCLKTNEKENSHEIKNCPTLMSLVCIDLSSVWAVFFPNWKLGGVLLG